MLLVRITSTKCSLLNDLDDFVVFSYINYVQTYLSIIKNTIVVCLCLSRINWKDYEKAENLYPGVILYCDNYLLVF